MRALFWPILAAQGQAEVEERGQRCPQCYRHFAHESELEQHLQWNQRCVASEIYERKRVTWQEAQEEAEMEIAQREQDWHRRGEGSGRGGGVRGKTMGPERKKDKKKRKKAPTSPTPVRTVRRDRRPPSPSTSSGRPKKKGGAGPRGPTVIHLRVGGAVRGPWMRCRLLPQQQEKKRERSRACIHVDIYIRLRAYRKIYRMFLGVAWIHDGRLQWASRDIGAQDRMAMAGFGKGGGIGVADAPGPAPAQPRQILWTGGKSSACAC